MNIHQRKLETVRGDLVRPSLLFVRWVTEIDPGLDAESNLRCLNAAAKLLIVMRAQLSSARSAVRADQRKGPQ